MSHPVRSFNSLPLLAAVLLVPGIAAAQAKKSAPAPAAKAPAAAKPAAPAAKPATPGAAGHTTTTTTAGHTGATTTTAGHTGATTTTSSHTTTTTTTSRTTTTAAGHTTPTNVAAHTSPANSAGTTHGGFGGRPAPAGAHEVRTASGAEIRTRPNGQRSDFHDPHRGMDVHHNLDGNRRISVERADHSRVFAERGGRGYVQHPYMYHGREFGHRTYYDHGRAYDRYYNHYGYRGVYLDVYAPARYYPVGFYGWAYNPWAVPITYSWGWGAAPWYGVYGGYFAPYPVYPSASFWLTDYLISNSLQAAYAAQAAANAQADALAGAPPPPGGPPVMTPEIKAMISTEVQRQVALENQEAAANAQKQDIDPAGSSIARLLGDNQVHVFVVGSDLDLVTNPDGTECPVSQGDVLKIAEPPAADATSAYAVVLSSKSWRKECRIASAVSVAFTDLQEMQNHMRETIDAGMDDLQKKQGQGGIPPAPPSAKAPPAPAAFAAVAPPPDPNAAQEIAEQTKAADQAEQEASGAVASGPSDPSLSASASPVASPLTAPTTTIAVGQSIDQVTSSLGQPKKVVDLGVKKIYIYPDMKITFKTGKVTTVE